MRIYLQLCIRNHLMVEENVLHVPHYLVCRKTFVVRFWVSFIYNHTFIIFYSTVTESCFRNLTLWQHGICSHTDSMIFTRLMMRRSLEYVCSMLCLNVCWVCMLLNYCLLLLKYLKIGLVVTGRDPVDLIHSHCSRDKGQQVLRDHWQKIQTK